MNEKLNLTKMDGTQVQANIICCLENTQTGKRYLYYTLNEIVGTGANSTVKIYVTKVKQNDAALDAMITDEEWELLKGYMSDALKGAQSSTIKYLPLSELNEAVSVSERVIAMPTSYDYINKHRGVYAQNVATIEPAPVSEPAPVQEEVQVQAEETSAPVEAPVDVTPEVAAEQAPVETSAEVAIEPANSANLNPIDLNEIEVRYEEMINSINRLKEQELEAAKRYNATLELNAMHNEQHANYVANEQEKETVNDTPKVAESPISNVVPTANEPEAITPIVPEPVAQPVSNPTDIETNWFDMSANTVQ